MTLLEHYEEWRQWLPLLLIGTSTPVAAWLLARPSPTAVHTFLAINAIMLVVGGLGIWFHLSGNLEFELELNSELSGGSLIWESLRGATPVLAPGALAQLGLLGILTAWKHPVTRADPPVQ